MPSPFPGMDPWLESPSYFPCLHTGFIGRLNAMLNTILPEPFVAAVSVRVYMEMSERLVEPDVDILRSSFESDPIGTTAPTAATSTLLLEIPRQRLPDDEITEIGIEVRTYDETEQLITSIELLSRANKTPGKTGRALYQVKQYELHETGVHLVEIDLLRGGSHATMVDVAELHRRSKGFDYHVSIARAEHWDIASAAPIRIHERLPTIPIPLTPNTPDVSLDLQAAFDQAYEEAGFDRRVRYRQPCNPRLTPDQQTWAETILRAKGLLPAIDEVPQS